MIRKARLTNVLLVLAIILAGFGCFKEKITVKPEDCVIVLPRQSERSPQQQKLLKTASQELQKHLELVTGIKIPVIDNGKPVKGKYPFYVGVIPVEDKRPFAPQESRWVITPKGTYLYGSLENGLGTQFAVYSFLENQLGIHWIEPGDEGIVYKKMSPLVLKGGAFNWIPKLVFRKIRLGDARIAKKMWKLPEKYAEFAEFQPSLEEHNKFAKEVNLWQKRVRMGGSRPGGGHAFSKWWNKYGKTHPEYFALNKFGKREPVKIAKAHQTNEFVKICPSNPKVTEQVITDWLPKKGYSKFVNVGVNDGAENFCECENCKKLDVPLKGERFADHLTDRYVYLANAVAREVRKHRPDACVTMYSYVTTLRPPRKLRLEPNIVVQTVPYVIPLDKKVTEDLLEGWYKAGATMLAFRPNYHCKYLTTSLPLGIEKQMFDIFQVAVKNGCISADYDSLTNNWPVTGISDYILSKAMSEPSKSFEHWENQYCSGFGAASADVKRYFNYWREQVWDKRLMPNIKKICNKGGAGDFARGLFWSLGDYYKLSDFDKTNAILKEAATKKLTPIERKRLNELQLANEHARLLYQAIIAQPAGKNVFAKKLVEFRRKHKDDLHLRWMGVFGFEIGNGDLTGLKLSKQMKGYLSPWLQTDLFWRFKLDPEDVGINEKWYEKSWEQTSDWEKFRTDRFWERQFEFDEKKTLSEKTAKQIERYDGIGWYTTQYAIPVDWKDRKIFLRFGAVDESCWVYVNGTLAGTHIFKHKNDWKTPFEIPINKFIDWNKKKQLITVRVEDKGGMGGIWRRVWIVSKK